MSALACRSAAVARSFIRPSVLLDTDSDVAWTRNLYDAAGRQTTTLSDYDISGHAGIAIEGFEGDSDGWDAGGSAYGAERPRHQTPPGIRCPRRAPHRALGEHARPNVRIVGSMST